MKSTLGTATNIPSAVRAAAQNTESAAAEDFVDSDGFYGVLVMCIQ